MRALVLGSLLVATSAVANVGGINSSVLANGTCTRAGCHNPVNGSFTMPKPTVTVTPSASTVNAGQQLTLSVVISAPNNKAGLNLRASSGTLSVNDSATHLLSGEITHNAPKAGANNQVTFTALWTAPAFGGTTTFTVNGNSVDGDGTNNGDNANTATASVTVNGPTCTPAAETCDGQDNDCNGQVDDGANLCGSGQSCVSGACTGGTGGGSGGGGGSDQGGCSVGGGSALFAAALLSVVAMRRRGRAQRC